MSIRGDLVEVVLKFTFTSEGNRRQETGADARQVLECMSEQLPYDQYQRTYIYR